VPVRPSGPIAAEDTLVCRCWADRWVRVWRVRVWWQTFRFINGKNEACFHMKRNPRKLNWTLFYRRLRKKGTQEDVLKKAKKRIVTSSVLSRGITGLSIDDLKAKKSEAPERRKAMREATVRCVMLSSCGLRYRWSLRRRYVMGSEKAQDGPPRRARPRGGRGVAVCCSRTHRWPWKGCAETRGDDLGRRAGGSGAAARARAPAPALWRQCKLAHLTVAAMALVVCRSAKDENRKKQEEKKKNAPKKVQGGPPGGGAVKMGKAGGAVIQPGRSSAPGKKSTR
jgi:hypothetical protein